MTYELAPVSHEAPARSTVACVLSKHLCDLYDRQPAIYSNGTDKSKAFKMTAHGAIGQLHESCY